LDFIAQGQMTFESLDRARFPCVALAEAASRGAGSMSIALNAANEIAVDSFLHELIRFTDIPIVIEAVLDQTEALETPTIELILAIDSEARQKAQEEIQKLAPRR
jgi:1-deoxy-D-xylulose-5-phosphate reductoisomerase